MESSNDSDYTPGDLCSSKEDEEATKIHKEFKAFKKKMRKGEVADFDDVVLERPQVVPTCLPVEDEGNSTPYADTIVGEDSI